MLNQDQDDDDTEDEINGDTLETTLELNHTYRAQDLNFQYGQDDYPTWSCDRVPQIVQVLEEAQEAVVTKFFTTAILTYCCAEMMGLKDLQDRVVAGVMEKERYQSHSHLGLVLETLFKATGADDEALRTKLVYRCLRNGSMIADLFPSAAATFKKYERVAWEVGREYNQQIERNGAVRESVERAQREISEALNLANNQIAAHERDAEDFCRMWSQEFKACECGRPLPGNSHWTNVRDDAGHRYIMCDCCSMTHSSRPLLSM